MEKLTEEEQKKLGRMCRQADCSKITVFRGKDSKADNALRAAIMKISGGRSVTLGNRIFLSDGDKSKFSALAHEATHAWQFQKLGGSEWLRRAVNDRVMEFTGSDPYAYRLNGKSFDQYNPNGLEQQAQMIEDCVVGSSGACSAAGFPGEGGSQ